jgi:DNA end-binding protein Ku
MAVSLIDALTSDWDPSNYRDTYRAWVLQLIEAPNLAGEVVETEEPEPETASVI